MLEIALIYFTRVFCKGIVHFKIKSHHPKAVALNRFPKYKGNLFAFHTLILQTSNSKLTEVRILSGCARSEWVMSKPITSLEAKTRLEVFLTN